MIDGVITTMVGTIITDGILTMVGTIITDGVIIDKILGTEDEVETMCHTLMVEEVVL
jgi:hypothetical protein